jgi:hypothetical protein
MNDVGIVIGTGETRSNEGKRCREALNAKP